MSAIGFVYCIVGCGTNLMKIGYSADPHRRLAELRTGNPHRLALVARWPGSREDEEAIHSALKRVGCGDLMGGTEWFDYTPIGPDVWMLERTDGERADEMTDVFAGLPRVWQMADEVRSARSGRLF